MTIFIMEIADSPSADLPLANLRKATFVMKAEIRHN